MLKHRLISLIILMAGAMLMACSQEPESDSQTTASSEGAETPAVESRPEADPAARSDETLERLAGDPAALREAMRDPEQREALMEAMRERREARRAERGDQGEDVDRAAMREQMRERRAEMMAERGADGANPRVQMRERMLERSRWWTDEDLQASIGLADEQTEALTQAQLQIEEQRQGMRQELGQQQQDLMAAIRDADRSSILDLVEQRSQTQKSLEDLELEWWRTMLDQLSDEQLAALAEQNPQVLMRRGGR